MNAAPSRIALPTLPPNPGASFRAFIAILCAAIARHCFRNPILAIQLLLLRRQLVRLGDLFATLLEKAATGEPSPLNAAAPPSTPPLRPRGPAPRPSSQANHAPRSRPLQPRETAHDDTPTPIFPIASPHCTAPPSRAPRHTLRAAHPPVPSIRAPPPRQRAGSNRRNGQSRRR